MSTALISTDPFAIVTIYPDAPSRIDLPGDMQVYAPSVPWQSADGAYRLVQVVAFVAPAGQHAVGDPAYAIDSSGNVTQTYATAPIPPTSVQVNSTATPALDGTYAFDAETQAKMMAVSLYIQANGHFPAGLSPFPWPDAGGTMHMFSTTAQFLALATAIADYATALNIGQSPTAPLSIP